MLTPEQYILKHNITDRTFRRWKSAPDSNLQLIVKNGETYVMDLDEIEQIKLNPQSLKMLIDNIKNGYNSTIMQIVSLKKMHCKTDAERKKNKAEAVRLTNEIIADAEKWAAKGVEIRGYTQGKVRAKIRTVMANDFELNPQPLKRAERYDKHVRFYNEQLQNPETREKILMLAAKFFFENAEGTMRPVSILVKEFAKVNEDFYEIAVIPRTTILSFIEKQFDSLALKQKHLYFNKYNKFRQKQVYNEGAFTTDISFMDWIMIDDKVQEVSGALVWDAVQGKWIKKKVYSWASMEAYTLHKITYKVKTEPFTAQEIKLLLMETLISVGRPKKGILMDNGLASSKICKEMLDQLKIYHDSGAAYEPLHKAVLERSWRFEKEEFNATFKNYIGGGRHEVRHSTKKLSPEAPEFTIEEYIEKLDAYMHGWYRNKPRERMLNYKKRELSIAEHWEECYKGHQFDMIPRRELAYSFKFSKVKKMNHFFINMGRELGVYDSKVDWMNPVYNEKKYLCVYNPLDTNIIDCYATEGFFIQDTAETVQPHQYVFSLHSQRAKGSAERQADVQRSRKHLAKSLRQTAVSIVNNELTAGVSALAPELNKAGKFVDSRKELIEYTKKALSEPIENVTNLVREKIQEKDNKLPAVQVPDVPDENLSAEDLLEIYSD